MGSFAAKLGRLPRPPERALARASIGPPPQPSSDGVTDPRRRPSTNEATGPSTEEGRQRGDVLADLRERIARIVARSPARAPNADPSRGELPFVRTETDKGPLYLRRARTGAGARVGRAPLVAARVAEPGMLALLALDPALAACSARGALYVDTETTGLAGGTGTVPFLIGLAWFDEAANAFVLEQLLLRRLGEEAPMLDVLSERIRAASMIVTYNGKAFDLPLLRTRYVMNRLEAPAEPPHLDLVHVARRIHGARLERRTLASIEHMVLGRVRVDDVPGGEVVQRYAHFLRTGDEEALVGVVEHNAADVLSMIALVGLYGEPLGSLEGEDLAGAARVVRRAGDLERAAALADQAIERGGGAAARHARGDIAKARGDKVRALVEYEAAARELEDGSMRAAAVRLELAKLYEHHVKAFARALDTCELGTGEADTAAEKRRERLRRKLARTEDSA
jgi:hypothetical protein